MMGSRLSSKRGSIAVGLVLLGIMVASMIALLSTLAAVQSAQVQGAYRLHMRGRASSTSLEIAATESLYALRETAPQNSAATFEEEFNGWLGRMNAGLPEARQFTISEDISDFALPAITMFPLFLAEEAPPPLAAPSAELLAISSPVSRDVMGALVAEYAGPSFQVSREDNSYISQVSRSWTIDTRLASVPVTRYPLHLYTLPHNLPSADDAEGEGGEIVAEPELPSHPEGGLSPGGLRGLKEFGATGRLSSTSLPYFYRPRVSLSSNAMRYVFSRDYQLRVTAYCGASHSLDLGAAGYGDPAIMALIDGVTQSAAQAASDSMTLDVGVAGYGTRTLPDSNVMEGTKSALCFIHAGASELVITESEDPLETPLMIFVSGSADPDDEQTRLVIDSDMRIERPLLIICYNVKVESENGVLEQGALILDPRCSVPETTRLRVAQLTMEAGSELIATEELRVRGAIPSSVHELAPRAVIAVAEASAL